MSTVTITSDSPTTGLALPPPSSLPPLENGDHLTRAEFMRRWEAMPGLKRAELIEGIVYMAAAVRIVQHGEPHGWLGNILSTYAFRTKGIIYGDNSTVGLDPDNAPQPDACLVLPAQMGSTAKITDDGYLEGPPDLIAEVAASTVSIDLHKKLPVYRSSGVREYIVWRVQDNAVDWFILRDGAYLPLAADGGIYKSSVFPGLWLDTEALLLRDFERLCQTLDRGMATAEYIAFRKQVRALLPPPAASP